MLLEKSFLLLFSWILIVLNFFLSHTDLISFFLSNSLIAIYLFFAAEISECLQRRETISNQAEIDISSIFCIVDPHRRFLWEGRQRGPTKKEEDELRERQGRNSSGKRRPPWVILITSRYYRINPCIIPYSLSKNPLFPITERAHNGS